MTATTIGQIAATSTPAYWAPAVTLAFLSGAMLLLMGVLRLGFFANFLSHPVISGFITASGLLIAASQLKTLMGVKAEGYNFLELIQALAAKIPNTHGLTLAVGVLTADIITRSGPIAAIALTAWLAWFFNWQSHGLRLVGTVPQGLPPLTLPLWDWALWKALAVPALLISLVGFVESVSVGQTLAAKRGQRIEPDRELVALGASNLSAAFTGDRFRRRVRHPAGNPERGR